MKRNTEGWLVIMLMGVGVSAAHAAEQGGQPTKHQATATPTAQSATTPSATAVSDASRSTQTTTASPLEATTWPVKVTPDTVAAQKGEKPFDDTLIFKDGKVTMSACVKMGFAPSAYTILPIGESWSFTTRQVSPAQGQTKWVATFTGETVRGTMTWTKQDGTILHYTIEGKKATTAGAS